MKQSKVIPIHNYHELTKIIVLLEELKGNSLTHAYIKMTMKDPSNIPILIAELQEDLKNAPYTMINVLGSNLVNLLIKYTP